MAVDCTPVENNILSVEKPISGTSVNHPIENEYMNDAIALVGVFVLKFVFYATGVEQTTKFNAKNAQPCIAALA